MWVAGEAIFKLRSSGPMVPGGGLRGKWVTCAHSQLARLSLHPSYMQSYEHVSSRPTTSPSTGFLTQAPSVVYGSLSGVHLGHWTGDWGLAKTLEVGAFLGVVSDSSWETGLHAPRTSKHGPGSAVYTPWEQVRSALWGTPRPAKSQNLRLDDLRGFRAHPGNLHRGSQAKAWSPPDHLPCSALQPHACLPHPWLYSRGPA